MEEVEFTPLFIVIDEHGDVRYVDEAKDLYEGESVIGRIYALDRQRLEAYIRNIEALWAHIDKLKKRIDPDYEYLLE